jgi:hypothetical protein
MWKEATMAYFKVVFQHHSGRNQEKYGQPQSNYAIRGTIFGWGPPEYEIALLKIRSQRSVEVVSYVSQGCPNLNDGESEFYLSYLPAGRF